LHGFFFVMSFNSDQVKRLQTILAENVGVQSVMVNGQSVSYADLEAKLDYYENKVARENGTRPRVFTVELGGGSQ